MRTEIQQGDPALGPLFDWAKDAQRLGRQMDKIRDYMLSHGAWRTLAEIEQATGYPQASISAQLRHLRKPQFGCWEVARRRRHEDGGTYEYAVHEPHCNCRGKEQAA